MPMDGVAVDGNAKYATRRMKIISLSIKISPFLANGTR